MILWSLAVWGPHVDLFARFHVPSMLLRGNLDALKAFGPVRLFVCTAFEDVERLRPTLAMLGPHLDAIELAVIDPDAMNRRSAHKIMADVQRHAVDRAIAMNAGLVFTFPDAVLPEGQYASLGEPGTLLREGVGCISGQGVSTRLDKRLWADHPSFAEMGFLHAPKTFADTLFSYEMIHPVSQARTISPYGPTTDWPSTLLWRSPEGVVMHAFHHMPLICWPEAVQVTWSEGLDGDFIDCARFSRPSIRVAETFTMAELCGPKTEGLATQRQKSPTEVAAWAAMKVKRANLQLFQHQIRLGGCPTNEWAEIQARELGWKALGILRSNLEREVEARANEALRAKEVA